MLLPAQIRAAACTYQLERVLLTLRTCLNEHCHCLQRTLHDPW